MKFWLEFFMDKRFGWRFKISNFIMGDWVRNYLAVDCEMLKDLARHQESEFYRRRIISIAEDLEAIMKG